jgi:hypothetical protein
LSLFGWLDYSEAQRRQALEVIDRFAEKGTVDELGLGTARDSLSDLLFPGLSVLHTRARYFLFIPWLYQDLEFRWTSSADAGKKARAQEIKLIYALADSEDPRGTIGIEAREKLKRFPSSVYWQGLGRWGIRLYQGAEPQYRRWLDRYYRLLDAEEGAGDGGDEDSRVTPNWHPGIPDPPDDFPDKADFALTRGEAEYLLDRVEQRAAGTFLAHLLRDGRRNDGVVFAWEHPIAGRLPERNQVILNHARLFSELTLGGPLLYNLLLAELRKQDDLVETYREALSEWAALVEERLPAANRWDRQDFWLTITRTGARVSPGTRAFIDRWIDLAMQPGVAKRLADNELARQTVAARERAIKGGMARVDNQRALELWNGSSGTGQLDYRWGQIQLLIDDILRGLGR